MYRLVPFLRWLMLRDVPADVAVAQFREVSRQLPMLYLVFGLGTAVGAFVYRDSAPIYLTVGITAFAVPLCIWRALGWRRARLAQIDAAQALGRMRWTVVRAAVIAAITATWVILIARSGSPGDVPLTTTLLTATAMGCILCLMYLPQAAIVVGPIVMIPYLVFLLSAGQKTLLGVMIEVAVVSAMLWHMVNRSFATFTRMIESQSALDRGRREAERLASENARLAYLDSLTGLPNRRAFFVQLDALVAARAGTGDRFAVMLLDLDRFKPVNDTYGHSIGDRLLGDLGQRLLAVSDERVLIARLGGDEFGVLIHACERDPSAIGQALCDLVSRPTRLDDIELSVGCSCGMATFPEAGTSGRELFDRSDYALYHTKSHRRGSCTLFSAEHERDIRTGQLLEAALQTADIEREMDLQFQPIVDTHSMTVVGVEALARWDSPILGRVPPDRFIPVAEGLGIVGTLTRALFRKALEHAALLPPEIGLSFNLSAHDIGTLDTVHALIALIERSGFPRARITFEITETAVMGDFEVAAAAIARLRALGIKVALDDFGTGFSSLTHLRRLPLDCVKVDRSFAIGLDDPSGHKIVSAIAGLCRNLGLNYVIEGIETPEQLLRMRQFGYRLAQGYLFAVPMTMPECLAWLARHPLDRPAAARRRIA